MKTLIFLLLSSFFLQATNAQNTFLKKIDGQYKYGLKDKGGKEITAPKYDEIKDFSDGIAQIKLNEKWGLIDSTGKELVYPKYDFIGELSLYLGYTSVRIDGKWGIIDISGNELVVPKYNAEIDFGWSRTRALVSINDPADKKNELWGLLDKSFKEIITPSYSDLDGAGSGYLKFSMDRVNVKYGLLGFDYKEIFAMKYDDIDAKSKDIISVKNNGKWTLVNAKGNAVNNIEYEDIRGFAEGRAIVVRQGKVGFIDEKGYEIIACKFDGTDYFKKTSGIVKAYVRLDGRKYYIDVNGIEIK